MRVTVVVGTYNNTLELATCTTVIFVSDLFLLFSNDYHIAHLNIKNQRIHS